MAENEKQPFNPNEHLMKIGKGEKAPDYLPVNWRLVWFREQCPNGTIETEVVHLDLDRETEEEVYQWNNETRRSEKVVKRAPGFAVFRAVVKDGKGGVATGTKSEKAASFADFIEKAETGAIGRALAALGFGTQFTGDEFDEKHRIVDAPVDMQPANDKPATTTQAAKAENKPAARPAQATTKPAQEAAAPAENKPIASIPTMTQILATAKKYQADKKLDEILADARKRHRVSRGEEFNPDQCADIAQRLKLAINEMAKAS